MTASTRYLKYTRGAKLDTKLNKVLLTHAFAEKNFSESALSYAEKTSTHYVFDWGRTASILIYELPVLFGYPEFHFFMRYMVAYCMPYMQENELTETKFYESYMENLKKTIVSV